MLLTNLLDPDDILLTNADQRWGQIASGSSLFDALGQAVAERRSLGGFRVLLDKFALSLRQPQHPAELALARAMLICAEVAAVGRAIESGGGGAESAHGGAIATLTDLLRQVDARVEVRAGVSAVANTLERQHWLGFVRECLRSMQWPTPLDSEAAFDLVLCLSGGARAVERKENVTALLVGSQWGDETGMTARLTLEALPEQSEFPADASLGMLYADPVTMTFVSRDTAFLGAELVASAWVRGLGLWPRGCDVRWRLTFPDGLRHSLKGGSMGAVFALGIAKLLAHQSGVDSELGRRVRALDLSGVAVTALVDESGGLGPIDGAFSKLLAAAREKAVPRVHTVVMAAAQTISEESLQSLRVDTPGRDDGSRTLVDPNADFHVITAPSVSGAVDQLTLDAATRWGEIQDVSVELGRHKQLVGREWLKERIDSWIAGSSSGYLLIEAGPGFGKTALIADYVRRNPTTVVHLIARGQGDWDDPDVILRSLTAQLRRKHPPAERGNGRERPSERREALAELVETLRRVGKTGQEVVLLDGLDEALGHRKRRPVVLDDLLPLELPPGIRFVLTSQPGEFLSWLGNPERCARLDLTGRAPENLTDIRSYLDQENTTRHLGIEERLLSALVEATQGFFLAAAMLVSPTRSSLPQDLARWRQDPSQIPVGLAGWFKEEWDGLLRAWAARGGGEPVVKAVLGIMALAREPLSREQLHALLTPLARQSASTSEGFEIGSVHLREVVHGADEVLKLAGEFFDPQDPLLGPRAPYQFFHTQFPEFIVDKLTNVERDDCHQALAAACERVFAGGRANDPGRGYALRYRIGHSIAAARWEDVARAFADADFIVAAAGPVESGGKTAGLARIHSDAETAAGHPNLPSELRSAFSDWERFLRLRVQTLQTMPEMYAQEVRNEFAAGAMAPIAQTLAQVRGPKGVLRLRKEWGPPAISGSIGHTEVVRSVAFSPDGTRVVSGSIDRTVKVWNAQNGHLLAECNEHSAVLSVAFSPDGTRVVSGCMDHTVKVWNAQNGHLLTDCKGHPNPVRSVAFSPDGMRVAAGSEDDTVTVWDAQKGDLLTNCKGQRESVGSVAFSPDGTRLASGSFDHTVMVRDARHGRPLAECKGHTDFVNGVAFSSDGARVVSGSWDTTVKVWDAQHGHLLANCKEHKGAVLSVAFSPDGTRVVSGSGDNTVKVWDAQNGHLLASSDCEEHKGAVLSVAFSPDGTRVVSGSGDNTVKVWDAQDGQLLADCKGASGLMGVACSRDGTSVVSLDRDGQLRVQDARNGHLLADCSGQWPPVALSTDGTRVVSESVQDFTLKVWDARTGDLRAECKGHAGLEVVAFSPDGTRIASGGRDGTVKVWDAQNGYLLANCSSPTDTVTSVAFSPNGTRVVSGGGDGTVVVLDAQSGDVLAEWKGHEAAVTSSVFSPDGTRIASGGRDGTVKVWDAHNGQFLAGYDGHTDDVTSVAFSPDGTRVVAGSYDRTASVWALEGANDGGTLDTKARRINTLFYERHVRIVAFALNRLLLIVDDAGQVFAYHAETW